MEKELVDMEVFSDPSCARVRQEQIESLGLQNIPRRFPVYTGRLHRHMLYSARLQPGGQFQQVRRHRPKAPGFLFGLAILGNHYAYGDTDLMGIQSTTTFE